MNLATMFLIWLITTLPLEYVTILNGPVVLHIKPLLKEALPHLQWVQRFGMEAIHKLEIALTTI